MRSVGTLQNSKFVYRVLFLAVLKINDKHAFKSYIKKYKKILSKLTLQKALRPTCGLIM